MTTVAAYLNHPAVHLSGLDGCIAFVRIFHRGSDWLDFQNPSNSILKARTFRVARPWNIGNIRPA